jgi:hypothetical protein
MKNIFSVIVLLVMATVSFGQESGYVDRKPGWHKIGEVKDFNTGMDGIVVDGPDTFRSIKLKINEASMDITKLIIYYHNNKAEEVNLVGKIKEGETKVFNLKYPSENLRKVVLTHRTDASYEEDKAHVELYGLK